MWFKTRPRRAPDGVPVQHRATAPALGGSARPHVGKRSLLGDTRCPISPHFPPKSPISAASHPGFTWQRFGVQRCSWVGDKAVPAPDHPRRDSRAGTATFPRPKTGGRGGWAGGRRGSLGTGPAAGTASPARHPQPALPWPTVAWQRPRGRAGHACAGCDEACAHTCGRRGRLCVHRGQGVAKGPGWFPAKPGRNWAGREVTRT